MDVELKRQADKFMSVVLWNIRGKDEALTQVVSRMRAQWMAGARR